MVVGYKATMALISQEITARLAFNKISVTKKCDAQMNDLLKAYDLS